MSGKYKLDENELDAVIGGAGEPTPTGSVTYTCRGCGTVIYASAGDDYVTCPNASCQKRYCVKNGKMKLAMTGPTPLEPSW